MELRFLTKPELEARLKEFCALYRRCFDAPINEQIVRHRFIENPYDDLLMCVAEDENGIAANYSVSPMRVAIGGRAVRAALSLNTMTAPEHRGEGLFVRLASMLYERMAEDGYGLVIGFPNQLSNPGFITRLGWKDTAEIPTLELAVPAGKENETGLAPCSAGELPAFGPKGRISVAKSPEYLNWRYNSDPGRQYLFAKDDKGSGLVYKVYQDQINVVEFRTGEESFASALGFLMNEARRTGAVKLTVWSALNTNEHVFFEKAGFINRYPVRYFSVKELAPQGIDLFDPRNWSISMGDDNVY